MSVHRSSRARTALLVVPAVVAPPPAAAADSVVRVFAPVADSYVSAAAPRANFGARRALRVGARPVRRAYLRFDVVLPANAVVTGATLKLHPSSARAPARFRAYTVADSRWRERRITLRSAPPLGAQLGIAAPSAARRYAPAALDPAMVRGGRWTIGVAGPGTRATAFRSREARDGPRLIVRYLLRGAAPAPPAPGPPPDATPPAPAPALLGPDAPPSGSDHVILAAGDIQADAATTSATLPLLDATPYDALLALGDLQYDRATLARLDSFYSQTWGLPAHKARTRPVPGNHDAADLAAGYCPYFRTGANGPAAVDPCPGGVAFYSYDLGTWHVVALDSSTGTIDNTQLAWLRGDLAAHAARCTLAYWHHPRYTGGVHGENLLNNVWQDLMAAAVDVVLVAHNHHFERFAPMDNAGNIDRAGGIREFVVGTGGDSHEPSKVVPGQEARDDGAFGVLRMTLRDGSYDWRFLPAPGATFTDSGADLCH